MEIIEELTEQENGEMYLTEEYARRLGEKGYQKEELLSKFGAFVTRKR